MADISAEKIIERLKAGKPVAAIVLCGADTYLREMCRNKIIETCVPEAARDWALARIAVAESGWDEVLQRAQTMPMLANRQVIIVEGVESLEKAGEKTRDEVVAALEQYFKSPAPFTVLLLEAASMDKRQRFYKLLAEHALIAELTIGAESAASLAMQMAKDCGAEIDRDAAMLLANILNSEPSRIRIEVEKLATYVQKGERITPRVVEQLVLAARKNTIWQLADMLVTRQRGSALAFLDNLLREGEQPAGLIGGIAWRYRKLIEARDLPAGTSGFQAARTLQMNPVAAEMAVREAHRIPKKDLLAGLVALAEADSQLKSSNPNPRALMEFLIVQLTSPAAKSAGSAA
jgi:DNA polymerase-3 subunit delta